MAWTGVLELNDDQWTLKVDDETIRIEGSLPDNMHGRKVRVDGEELDNDDGKVIRIDSCTAT